MNVPHRKIKKPTRRKISKPVILIPPKLPPIIVVPDKTYIDDTGNVIPTDVILIADPEMYRRMSIVLKAWGTDEMGIPGQRGVIEG